MKNPADRINAKLAASQDVLEQLKSLSGSELNSLLLELFRQRSAQISAASLLQQYETNRFVSPAKVEAVKLRETEASWLQLAMNNGFDTIQFSPLAPFGSCSAVAAVDQNNVVSALRGTEVASDATNLMALQIASEFRKGKKAEKVLRYATTHRHVRGQHFSNPAYSAHFTAFCLASGGLDTGSYRFETVQLKEQLLVLCQLLSQFFDPKALLIRFYGKPGGENFVFLRDITDYEGVNCEFSDSPGTTYYQTFQFKIFLKRGGQEIDLADGGMVDWTQKLLQNKKHRLMISGIGLELVLKLYK